TFDGLQTLTNLRELSVTTPPSWDGSHRCIEIDSYAPVQALTRLERLHLLGVRPHDLDLARVATMRQLKDLHIAGVPEFTLEHYAKLSASLPTTTGRSLQPFTEVEGVGFCTECFGRTVLLTGAAPRTRRWLCPRCDEKKLAKHVAQWDE